MNDLKNKILNWISRNPEKDLPKLTLGKVIKKNLRDNDLEINSFAKELDISEHELNLILSDRFRPAIQILEKIANIIDYSFQKLSELAKDPTFAPLSLPITRSTAEKSKEWSDSQKDDAKCVEQIINGNNEAFGDLYDKYFGFVKSVLKNHMSSESDIEDIIQESWKKVYLSLKKGSYNKRGQFKSWLAKVVSTCRLDWLRKLKKSSVFLRICRRI